jgi:hypothetical protein
MAKMNGKHQHLVCTDEINVASESINIIKNTVALLKGRMEVGLEVNTG